MTAGHALLVLLIIGCYYLLGAVSYDAFLGWLRCDHYEGPGQLFIVLSVWPLVALTVLALIVYVLTEQLIITLTGGHHAWGAVKSPTESKTTAVVSPSSTGRVGPTTQGEAHPENSTEGEDV